MNEQQKRKPVREDKGAIWNFEVQRSNGGIKDTVGVILIILSEVKLRGFEKRGHKGVTERAQI